MKKLFNKLKLMLILWLLPKTAKELCYVIDQWSISKVRYNEPYKLWLILSAIRGPDKEHRMSRDIKWQSTAVLRALLFPNLNQGDINLDTKEISLSLANDENSDLHFRQHIILACTVADIGIIKREKSEPFE